MSAGTFHSLALRSDGTVWEWGGWGPGDNLTPVEVAGLTGVTKIAAGDGFGLALRSDGTVWAWGNNYAGQPGDGATANSTVPVQVSGLSQVTSIAAGADSALAVRTRGITTLTTVWAWGGNVRPDRPVRAHQPGVLGVRGQGRPEGAACPYLDVRSVRCDA